MLVRAVEVFGLAIVCSNMDSSRVLKSIRRGKAEVCKPFEVSVFCLVNVTQVSTSQVAKTRMRVGKVGLKIQIWGLGGYELFWAKTVISGHPEVFGSLLIIIHTTT